MAVYKVKVRLRHEFVQYEDFCVEVNAPNEEEAEARACVNVEKEGKPSETRARHFETNAYMLEIKHIAGEEEEYIPRLPAKFLTKALIMQGGAI